MRRANSFPIQSHFTLNAPISELPGDHSWAPNSDFDQALFQSATAGPMPDIYSLQGLDPNAFPTGPIELSVENYQFDASLFEGFDFSAFDAPLPEPQNEEYPPVDYSAAAASYDMYNMAPYLPSPAPTSMSTPCDVPTPYSTTSTATNGFQPPPGAQNYKVRRVGGAWTPGDRLGTPDPSSSYTRVAS